MKNPTSLIRTMLFGSFLIASVLSAQAETAKKTLSQGTWQEKNYEIKGMWETRQVGDKTILVLDDKFATKSAPDLKIFLHPKKVTDIDDDNATEGAIFVSKLRTNKGKQVYEIPKGTKLSDYQSVIIHCEEYSVLWGGAPLAVK